jgi:hypothetical protein
MKIKLNSQGKSRFTKNWGNPLRNNTTLPYEDTSTSTTITE